MGIKMKSFVLSFAILLALSSCGSTNTQTLGSSIGKEIPLEKGYQTFSGDVEHLADSIVKADNLKPFSSWKSTQVRDDKGSSVIHVQLWREYHNGDTISIITKVDNTDVKYKRYFIRKE